MSSLERLLLRTVASASAPTAWGLQLQRPSSPPLKPQPWYRQNSCPSSTRPTLSAANLHDDDAHDQEAEAVGTRHLLSITKSAIGTRSALQTCMTMPA